MFRYSILEYKANICFCFLDSDLENTEGADLQRKLEMLNNIMDQEARAEQARRQIQYYGHCEFSNYKKNINLLTSTFSKTFFS